MLNRPILLISNRGPISFRQADDGSGPIPTRGAGGLVSGLSPLLMGRDREWLAAALSDDDREAVSNSVDSTALAEGHIEVEVDGVRAHLLAVDADDLRSSYEVVCNDTLWFVHHYLFDLAHTPVFDDDWWDAWSAYRRVNEAFARAAAEIAPRDAAVLVQDYHLCLVGPLLAELRPDVRTVHFSHTPFAAPELFRILPDGPRVELLRGLAGHDACGFHTERWRALFAACCEADGVATPPTFVSPLAPDAADLRATVASQACQRASEALSSRLGSNKVIARVDRMELSKNILRGFQSYELLLQRHPEWVGNVTFVASLYPSRESHPAYVAYHQDVSELVVAINDRWSTATWQPIVLYDTDDFPRSIATLRLADVVLVNSVRDGLNLVAKEAMLVNDRDAMLALSPEAGVWDELAGVAERVHPFDISHTADVLHELLSLNGSERAIRAERLRTVSAARTPADWLADQLVAAEATATVRSVEQR